MEPTVKPSFPLNHPTEAMIPEITLDPFSVTAYFSLYNVLNEKDRFAINYSHGVTLQKSNVLGTLPYFNKEVNTQTVWRKFVYFNDRNEASDFVIAILESVSAYLKHESFKKMLPILEKGLIRYSESYGPIADNAKTSILFAVNRVREAISWTQSPEDFQLKHKKELPNELIKNRTIYYDQTWKHDEITVVVNLIQLAILKNEEKQDCTPEIESTLTYLEHKQNQMVDLLKNKSKVLSSK